MPWLPVDVTFIPDGVLDELARPSVIGRTRVGGLDLDQARTRTIMAAVTALAAASDGFTVSDLAGTDSYTIRQDAYDYASSAATTSSPNRDGNAATESPTGPSAR
jgi:hypothetical protein